jgi:glycosyltransferase involved in cell wall biosynthesis
MKIIFVHPALMDYRLKIFEELNKVYDITFIFTTQGQGQAGVKEKHLEISKEWDYKIIRSDKIIVQGRPIITYFKLIRELLKSKYDIILTSTNWYICFPIARITEKRFILLTEYWYWAPKSLAERLLYQLTRFIARHADAIITGGTKSYEAYLGFGVKNEKIFKCIQCALDYSNLPTKDLRKELGIEEKKKIILYLSRIVAHKGLDYLIKAFALLEKEAEVALLIVGDGPFRQECEDLVKDLGAKNVFFMGRVFDDIIKAAYYKVCDIFVLPAVLLGSAYDPWSLVINEAIAFGKPIITTDTVGAAYDLVKEGYNGYVVKNKNVQELYTAMHKILLNPQLAKEMGKNSRKMFEEKNDYGKMFKAFENAISYVRQK